ncbi:MAG: hypothetical protein ACFCU1_06585 [Sumerlaeia bacterium]
MNSALQEAPAANHRFGSLDSARGLAICLALFAHLVDATQFTIPALQQIGHLIGPLLRSSTGIFILIMGVLIEVIHGISKQSPQRYKWRLPQRAIICYCYGLVLLALGEMLALNPPGETWKGALMLGSGRMSQVFFFLPLLLISMVPVIALRRKIGLPLTCLAAVFLWLLALALPQINFTGSFFRLNYLSSRLIGRPLGFDSFSLAHMLPLIVYGMAIGRAIVEKPARVLAPRLLIIGSLFIVISLLLMAIQGQLLWSLDSLMAVRKNHQAVYYAFVCGAATVALGGFLWAEARGLRTPVLEFFGRNSILIFFIGNGLLLLYMGYGR